MYLKEFTRHSISAARSRQRLRFLGVTPKGHRLWTPEEDEICRKYGHDYSILGARLPHRTYKALRARCQRLGIRPKRKRISAKQLSTLRRLYPSATKAELLDAFPGYTLRELHDLASYYGLKRRVRAFASTGFPIIDAVRERARELNYSMPDVDEIAGTGKYFQKAGWFNHTRPNFVYVSRAVEALGGTLVTVWDEL